MKVYIAGPMTGLLNFNYEAFHEAEQWLKECGHEPISPTLSSDRVPPTPEEAKPWDFYVRKAIRLLTECEGIYMLSGWEASKGAKLEKLIADELGMKEIRK